MAWVHIAAHTDGSTRLCCMSSRFIKKDNGENFNLGYDKIEDIVNSTDYTQIRNDMLEGKSIKGCESCYESEKYSQTSHRTRFNTTWMKDERFVKKVEQSKNKEPVANTIEYFDIRYGNLCNLSCRYCYSEASSQYNKEITEINSELFNPITIDFNSWYETDTFKENLYSQIPNLSRYYVAGGEPTIIDKNYESMKYMVESGHSKHIELQISTNLTNTKHNFYSLIPSFKQVTFLASIDGVGKIQEYMRYPSKWSQIDANFRKVIGMNSPNINITITPVLQKVNLEFITELFEYAEEFNRQAHKSIVTVAPIILSQPSYFDFSFLPLDYKQQCWEKINDWATNHCKYQDPLFWNRLRTIKAKCLEDTDYTENLVEFSKYTTIFDNHRNVQLADVNPILDSIRHK